MAARREPVRHAARRPPAGCGCRSATRRSPRSCCRRCRSCRWPSRARCSRWPPSRWPRWCCGCSCARLGRAGRGSLVDGRLAAAGRAAPRAGAQHPGLRPGQRRADGPGGAGLPDRRAALAARRAGRHRGGGEADPRARSCCSSCSGGTTGPRPTAAVSFAASTGAGLPARPARLGAVLDVGRLPDRPARQPGVRGQPVHPGGPGPRRARPAHRGAAAAWLALSAVVLALACRGMRRALAAGRTAWALSLNAFAALLISPISWSHHWVWGETAMLTLACLGRRTAGGLAVAARRRAGSAVFAAAPQWWLPSGGDRELRWAAWQQVLGSSLRDPRGASCCCSALLPRRASPRQGLPGAAQPGSGSTAIGCYRFIRDISWSHYRLVPGTYGTGFLRALGFGGRCGCGI